jgi:hypothetical protein
VRAIGKLAALAGVAAALACEGGRQEPASKDMNADLRRDLELASSANLGLASSSRDYPATQIVSDVERVPVSKAPAPTSKAPRPRRNAPAKPVRHVTHASPVPSPKPVEIKAEPTVVATAPTPAPEPSTAPAPEPTAEPRPAPRPTPIPGGGSPYPGQFPGRSPVGDGGVGGVIGGIVGVVIRGGGAGVDNCDERDIPIRIGGHMPIMRPTYPRY